MPLQNKDDLLELEELIDIGRTWYSFKNYTSLSETELGKVRDWRNHESIRKWMHNQAEICWDDHLSFIDTLRQNTSKVYWLVERDGEPVGSLNLTILSESKGEWGYYLAPQYMGKGFGIEFYYFLIDHLILKCDIDELIGYAKLDNAGANSLNKLFGFFSEDVELNVNGKLNRYLKWTLTKDLWMNTVSNNNRLIELTCKSIRVNQQARK